MELLSQIFDTALATVRDVLPIAVIIVGFQLFVIRRPIPNLFKVAVGFGYVLVGLSLFLIGLEKALFPLGRLMAEQLTAPEFVFGVGVAIPEVVAWHDYMWVYVFGAAIGFATAMAEPALIAVAMKASQVSGGTIGVLGLRVAVALGAAIGIAIGALRIVIGIPLYYIVIAAYVVVIIQTFFAPRIIVPLAYDSGGVTTSTVTVPIVAALGLGLASVIPGRSALLDGFGMIATTCLFPIVTVMAYAQFSAWRAKRTTQHAAAAEESHALQTVDSPYRGREDESRAEGRA